MQLTKTQTSRSVSLKAREVLKLAESLVDLIEYKDDFSNALLAPNGIVAGAFPAMADRQLFFQTNAYRRIWKLISSKSIRPPTGEVVWIPPRETRTKKQTGAKPA